MPGVISRLLGAPRALELRTAEDLAAHLRGSGRTWSGIDVTPDSALHVSAFFDGVRIIAEDIGKLPFIVYRRRCDDRGCRIAALGTIARGTI